MGVGILGVQAQRLAEFRHGTIPVVLVYEHAAEVEVRRLIIRVQAQRLVQFRDGTNEVALASKRITDTEVR